MSLFEPHRRRGAPAVTGGYVHYEEDDLRKGFSAAAKFILERCSGATK